MLSVQRWWLFGNDRSALAFTPAEIQFLFPAPGRGGVIHSSCCAANPIVFNAILCVLIFGRGGTERPRCCGCFRSGRCWHLHAASARRHDRTRVRRRAGKGASAQHSALVIFGAMVAACLDGRQGLPAVRDAAGFRRSPKR